MKRLAITFILVAVFSQGATNNRAQSRAEPDLCENSRRRVNELKIKDLLIRGQLDLNDRDEKNARTALSDFNDALSNPSRRRAAVERHLGSTVSEQTAALKSLGLKWKSEYLESSKVLLLRAARDAQIRKVQRIRYARTHHDELNQQMEDVRKQLVYHYNLMTQLGCGDAEETPKGDCDGFAGTWETNVGKLTLKVNGDVWTGSYDFDGGTLTGGLTGKVLSGKYSEHEAEGTFEFTLADDGQSFTGKWKRTSGKRLPASGGWRGKCVGR